MSKGFLEYQGYICYHPSLFHIGQKFQAGEFDRRKDPHLTKFENRSGMLVKLKVQRVM